MCPLKNEKTGTSTITKFSKQRYCLFQDMLINFQQIILPDILMSLIKGEPSVQNVVESFSDDVIRSHDLFKLCTKLETMLRNIIFGAKVSKVLNL